MSESDDEFGAYDFSEFTEEDFAAIDAELARARAGPAIQIAIQDDSPFRNFLSWKSSIAVTDLVSPLWCEVQYEYGLYGERHKPLHKRPSTFTSKSGKKIHVCKQAARATDRRLRRGRSVHQALEDEVKPEKIVVRPATDEERFGLRLVQLIDGFNQLVCNGMTRELPVFTITHSQVVTGVIDEVVRSPLIPPNSPSGSPPSKKQRLTPTQSPKSPGEVVLATVNTADDAESTTPKYEFRIIDHKTRHSPSIPTDDDSLSSRIQLMMYHRMLSSVLRPEALDFGQLWDKLRLNPTKPFSPKFLKDICWEQRQGPADGNVHLNHLVSEWISTVCRNSVGLAGVSQQLELVYRSPVYLGKPERTGKQEAIEAVDAGNPLEALALQEELDLARAVEESLGEVEPVNHHAAQSVVHETSPSRAAQNDRNPPLDFVLHGPVLPTLVSSKTQGLDVTHGTGETDASDVDGNAEFHETVASKGQGRGVTTTSDISPIIGRKEFSMDNDKLDAQIVDVLRWWFGARPARGVDVHQTHRCETCDYLFSCEWRKQKAGEATIASTRSSV